MNSYRITYSWTFAEVIDSLGYQIDPWHNAVDFDDIFYTELSLTSLPLWKTISPVTSKDYIEDLWQLIIARFHDWYFLETNSNSIDPAEANRALITFANIIVVTYDKYAGIIKSFKSIQSDLMKQVNSTTETGYNDTPQSEGSYGDTTHRSSYTKVTSLVDGETPIERLNEINNKLKNIMLDWSNEFKRLFWEE